MQLDLPLDRCGAGDKANHCSVHASSIPVLEIQVEGLDTGIGTLVGLLLVEG